MFGFHHFVEMGLSHNIWNHIRISKSLKFEGTWIQGFGLNYHRPSVNNLASFVFVRTQ